MASPGRIAAHNAARAAKVAELAEEARRLAAERVHSVSHLSSNLASMENGLEDRPYGTSFARLPHERMSSPVVGEPSGRPGIVYARVAGEGLDYASRPHRDAVDAVVMKAIESGGTAEDAYRALRQAGVQWVNNWNGVGAADELYALDPKSVSITRVFDSPRAMSYRFPRPDSELGVVVDGDWKRAATDGPGMPEVRGVNGRR